MGPCKLSRAERLRLLPRPKTVGHGACCSGQTMSPQNKPAANQPVVDEWGFYDPYRAGLSAVFDKLEAQTVANLRGEALKVGGSRHVPQIGERK